MHDLQPEGTGDLMSQILRELHRRLDAALAAGIAWERLIVDPGFGFGKQAAESRAAAKVGRIVRPGPADTGWSLGKRPSPMCSAPATKARSKARWPQPRWRSRKARTSFGFTMPNRTSASLE